MRIRELGRMPVSIQASSPGDPEHSVEEILVDKDELSPLDVLILNETREVLSAALESLTAEERNVVELRYGLISYESLSVNEIAKKLRLERNLVETLESTALTKLRYFIARVV